MPLARLHNTRDEAQGRFAQPLRPLRNREQARLHTPFSAIAIPPDRPVAASNSSLSTKYHLPMEFPALAPFTVPIAPSPDRIGRSGNRKIIVDVAQMAADEQQRGLILVVEDEAIIRDFVCEILGDEGFITHALENADEAESYLNGNAAGVSLLLTDILMPGSKNGAELANLSVEKWPQIPILIMSGHETPESSGVTHPVTFIRKPWQIGQLIDGVDKALKTRQAQ